MADVEKITIGNDTYDIRDATALQNIATGSHSFAVGSTGHPSLYAGTAVGMDTDIKGNNDIVVGYQTTAKTDASGSVHGSTVIGSKTAMKSSGSCHIGAYGHNSVDGTFTVSLGSDGNDYTTFHDYTMCDINGIIPILRMISYGNGAPTGTGVTGADIGRIYIDITNEQAYICVKAELVPGLNTYTYTWKQITA